jgi:hypothetical protein
VHRITWTYRYVVLDRLSGIAQREQRPHRFGRAKMSSSLSLCDRLIAGGDELKVPTATVYREFGRV